MPSHKIEIVDRATDEVVETIDCHGKSLHDVQRVERGVQINLNHLDFYTRIVEDCELFNGTKHTLNMDDPWGGV